MLNISRSNVFGKFFLLVNYYQTLLKIFPPVPRDSCDTDIEAASATPFVALESIFVGIGSLFVGLGPPLLGLAFFKIFFKNLKNDFPYLIPNFANPPRPLFSEVLKYPSLKSSNCSLIKDMYSSCSQ